MITFWLIVLLLLAAAAALFLVPALRTPRGDDGADRDRLNTQLYHQRLRELAQDEAQGLVEGHAEMLTDLQHNLLNDVPKHGAPRAQPIGRWALLPGVLVLVALSLGFYLKTGGWSQVAEWQRVMTQLPQLRERVMHEDQQPLDREELTRLGLGLRTELQSQPNNVADWVMLGRIGMALNNATTATQAFAHAYKLAPNAPEVALGYAEVLTRSSDAQDNRDAAALLRRLLSQDHQNTRVLSLLAFNAFEQGEFRQAIGAWEMMLKLLPPDDRRRDMIERSIAQARVQAGIDAAQVRVDISMDPALERQLPSGSQLMITLTDGRSPLPVAVKRLPLGHFPQSVTLSDGDAMMPERLLSSLTQFSIRARVVPPGAEVDGPSDVFGESAVLPYTSGKTVAITLSRQAP
ncbi:c-type cytochrome biogenesis protein CcmI [Edwardsiella piscicida]|uniref:c-type cytochrome biogenesis protein CcmI n=1 Tax=Edwardsiella piscicida TaxID=1263550 RepID=UPI00370D1EEC